jgi:hypothetical protein
MEKVSKGYLVMLMNIRFRGHKAGNIIKVSTMFKPQADKCKGYLTITNYTLHEALVKYPVKILNGTIMMENRLADRNDTILLFPYPPGDSFDRSTLGSIALVAQMGYISLAEMY